jgi:hypothetical protein
MSTGKTTGKRSCIGHGDVGDFLRSQVERFLAAQLHDSLNCFDHCFELFGAL